MVARKTDLFKLQEIVIASADPKLMPDDTTVFLFIILSFLDHNASAFAVLCMAAICALASSSSVTLNF